MSETIVPIGLAPTSPLPPGLVTNGSMFERQGRWAGGNLVRFDNGYPQPFGPWVSLTLSPTLTAGVGAPCGAFLWPWTFTTGVVPMVIMATDGGAGSGKLYVIQRNGGATDTTYDITPVGAGIGAGNPSSFNHNDSFVFDHFGNTVLASRAGFGSSLWKWNPETDLAQKASIVGGSPSIGFGVFVTPEQFVMVISDANDIDWASQGTLDTWTPTSTNSAGGLTIPTKGMLLRGMKVRGQTLLWSDEDVWALDYVGAPLYYGATLVGSGTGLIGPNAVVVVKETAYWMGPGGFFKYDGYVQQLRCDVAQTVFSNTLARQYGNRFFAIVNAPSNEIWWFYCSSVTAATPDKMVAYNYANDTWTLGDLARSAGTDARWPDINFTDTICPILFDANGTTVYRHETSRANNEAAAGAYVESGPFQLDSGERTALVAKIFPEMNDGTDQITIFSNLGHSPDLSAETANGPYSMAGWIDTRIRARYIRYKQTLTAAGSRVGIPKVGIIPSGRR